MSLGGMDAADGMMGGDPIVPSVQELQRGMDLASLNAELHCLDPSCTEVFSEFREHPTWFCDGGPNLFEGGNWIGHVFPGTLFIFWASHWLLGYVRHYYEGQKRGEQFRSKTCYRFLWFPEAWPMEAVVKAVFPLVAILLELWLAHPGGYRQLFCSDRPNESARQGHFIGNHLNNWQHAMMYPGFIVSGIVDLVSLVVEPPPGTQQVFLAISFMNEALLFGLHGKHAPMDILVHKILTYSALACALFPALECVWLHNPLLVAGRIVATYLHGAWFLAAARMMYETHPAWDLDHNRDILPVIYAANMFVSLIMYCVLGVLSAMVVGYIIYRPKAQASKQHANPWEQPQ